MINVAPAFFLVFLCQSAVAAFDADGVALGAAESEVRKRYPSARCKALEWTSRAADRRCDDARVQFAGAEARITFYLRKGAVVAFDVRFDTRDTARIAGFLKSRYGKPLAEEREAVERKDRATRQTVRVLWEKNGERAVLVSVLDKRRASLLVSRGDFEEEIYRVR